MRIFPVVRLLTALLAAGWICGQAPRRAWGGAAPVTYYVAPEGDDTRDGQAPERAWRSLARVNAATAAPGDRILFRRGGQWRGQLIPRSGSAAGAVTYGAYGMGDKPALLGSVALNEAADWQPAGPNLWVTAGLAPQGGNLLETASLSPWQLHGEQGAAAQGQPAAGLDYTVRCIRPGASGSHLQLYLAPLRIAEGKTYQLRFRARSSRPFPLQAPRLMAAGAPWTPYATGGNAEGEFSVGTEWTVCEQFYHANRTANDARFTFFLGGALPAGAELAIDGMALRECAGRDSLPCDVGNIIFNDGAAWGVKKWNAEDLRHDLDYRYDIPGHTVTLYSAQNPARRFRSVELALRQHIIDESGRNFVSYENLALCYGGAHGIGGGNTHHITVRGCDISWIGGGHQFTPPGGKPVRYGNGIEFWANAHDNLVEGCRIWEVYDAALTNQNQGGVARQTDITYRQNVIWNCEYSFEYWNRPAASLTRNIVFEHNTCYGAGFGWGHAQRPDPAGRQLCFYTNDAQTLDLAIHDNIFCEATDTAFDALGWTPAALADRRQIRLERNCWHQPAGTMIRIQRQLYPQARFGAYQRETGQDQGSWAADPRLSDPRRAAFGLRPDSPCPGAGAQS